MDERYFIDKLVKLYADYWPGIVIGLLINWIILFFLNRRLHKDNTAAAKTSPQGSNLLFSQTVVLLAVFFTAWKSFNLDRESFDIMESTNLMFLHSGIGSFLTNMIFCSHQPLYHIISEFINNIAGAQYGLISLRFFSVVFGVLTAYLAYKLCFVVFNRKDIAISSFILLNIHFLFVFYSRRIEVYTAFSFLSLLSCYYFWQAFVQGFRQAQIKYAVVLIISFLTHYLTIFLLFGQICAILLLKARSLVGKRESLLFVRSVFIGGFLFILYLPLGYLALWDKTFRSDGGFLLGKESLSSVLGDILRLLSGTYFLIPALGFCLLAFIFLYLLAKENKSFFLMIVSILTAGFLYESFFLLRMISISGKLYFNIRQLLWLVPFLTILYSYGLIRLLRSGKRCFQVAGLVLVIFLGGINLSKSQEIITDLWVSDYNGALGYISQQIDHQNDFLGYPCCIRMCIKFNSKGRLNLDFENSGELYPGNILKKKERFKRFWIIIFQEDYFGSSHLNSNLFPTYLDFLNQQLDLISVWSGNKIKVYLYTPKNAI